MSESHYNIPEKLSDNYSGVKMIIKEPMLSITGPFIFLSLYSCINDVSFRYKVTMENPSGHLLYVVLNCDGLSKDTVILSMPAWMPGSYQLMKYSANVLNMMEAYY